ncbi:hypothetical protein NKG94_30430 [Micromonospora sp. M12]
MPTIRTAAELLAHERPDFVLVSVPWPVTPDVTRELVAAGVPVLAETPPAPTWPACARSGPTSVAAAWCRSRSSTC